MKIFFYTDYVNFTNDFRDILNIFFSNYELCFNEDYNNIENNDIIIKHNIYDKKTEWECTLNYKNNLNEYNYNKTSIKPVDFDVEFEELFLKRDLKRLCKQSLYNLLKKVYGKVSPWGSLTGVRPTYLMYEHINNGYTIQQAENYLVDEYDVDIKKVKLLSNTVNVQKGLKQSSKNDFDLYISIPFCNTRCVYCSFPGETLKDDLFVDDYLNALILELKSVKKLCKQNKLKLRCVYIGGGTPTSINQFQINKLLSNFLEIFPEAFEGCEFTVEAGRPDSITFDKLKVLSKYNVSRISINPQTMLDKTLKLIGRNHNAMQTINAYKLAKDCGFNNINMDTIMGLPGESFDDFKYTMDEIFKLNPEGLTIHSLAIKKGSKLALNNKTLTDDNIIQNMADYGDETAKKLNMEPYYLYRQKYMSGQQQNIAYSKMGKECLYNVDIMEENVNIIAVGAGAISKRVFFDKNKRIERAPNVSNVSIYIERITQMIERKFELFNEN